MRLSLFVLAPFLLATAAQAQQPAATPTLDQVLTGVHSNFSAYLGSVPSLIADEHVVSSFRDNMMQTSGGTTDSIFRMRRGEVKNNQIQLVESREAKGPHSGEQTVDGPSVAVGLFSYGVMDISPDLKNCYDFRLENKPQQLRHTPVIVLDYALKGSLDAGSKCPVTEPVSGKAFVDPAAMQVLRVEQRRSNHEVMPKRMGIWFWSVDYGLVDLDGKTFWLPQTISAQSSSNMPRMDWSFVATYRDYHLLAVRTTILPATAAPKP